MAEEIKYRTCNLCEAICGLEITVEDGVVSKIRGDKEDVFSKGHICPKAVALKDLYEDPDRLRYPLRKVDGKWERMEWEDAFEYVADRLVSIQKQHGDNAVGIYQGNPSIHNLGTTLFSPNFVRSLKTTNRFSATSVDQLGHHLAAEFMFGHMNKIPVPDIDRTDFWVIMGGNPIISNGSLMTAPDVSGRLKAIQTRGGKVITIDPRRTETAERADEHVFIRPGSDVYLLLAVIREIIARDEIRLGHLADIIDTAQIEQIRELVDPYTVDLAVAKTGIPKETIDSLITGYISAKRAVWYGRLGVSANRYGGLCHWAINTLNILTGHFDTEGGAMFTSPAVDIANRKSRTPKFNRWQSRVSGLPETGGELPSGVMVEEILTPGEGQIRAMVTSCGNPVLSVPNGNKLDEAFDSLEFMVSIDIYLNETTRHADVILPPATGLEVPHYPVAFHNLAVRNTANFSEPTMPKAEGARYDYEIFLGLQQAIEKRTLSEEEIEKKATYYQMNPELLLNMGLSAGNTGADLSQLKANPHGIDLGPLRSNLKEKILTNSGKIDLMPSIYIDQLQSLTQIEEDQDTYLLIGRRHLRSNNSWLHNSQRMVKGPVRCTALLHPDDAQTLALSDGETITVSSDVGQVSLPVEISDEMMPGTVSIPHGWGHHRDGIQMSVAKAHAGVSMNDLIDNKIVDTLSGVSVISGIPVQISAGSAA